MDKEQLILRIARKENAFNRVRTVLEMLQSSLDAYDSILEQADELADYMECGQWLKDFEADEQGMIPPGLQRGVLSQDALYNLLSDWDGLRTRLAEYANNIRPIQFP